MTDDSRTSTNIPKGKLSVRVLLVEDDEVSRQMLMQCLTATESMNLQVSTVSDGVEALQFLTTNKTDLIITDQHMPRMTGLDFIRRVRDDILFSAHHEVPVIAITGDFDEELYKDFVREGVHAVVIKPIRCTEIRKMVEKSLLKIY